MIRHVVLMRFKPDADPSDIAFFAEEVKTLQRDVATVRGFASGPNLGTSEEGLAAEAEFDDNFDFAVIADFDDYDGYQVYANSDAHHRLISVVVRKILATRVAVQYEVA